MTNNILFFVSIFLFIGCSTKNKEESYTIKQSNFTEDTTVLTDDFNEAIIQVENDLKYYSQTNHNEKKYIERNDIDTLLKNKFQKCIGNSLNKSHIINVKTALLKSEKPISDKLFLNVSIQEWTFLDTEKAEILNNHLNNLNRKTVECISKGGLCWWRIDNKIYLIISSVYRYSFEFKSIQNSLNKKL